MIRADNDVNMSWISLSFVSSKVNGRW